MMERRAYRILSRAWVKAIAIALFVISILTFALSTAAIVVLGEVDAYRKEENFRIQKDEFFYYAGNTYARDVANKYIFEDTDGDDTHYYINYDESNWQKEGWNYDAVIRDSNGQLVGKTDTSHAQGRYCYTQNYEVSFIYGSTRLAYENIYGDSREERKQAAIKRASELEADYYDSEIDSEGNIVRAVFYRYLRFTGTVEISLYENPLISDDFTVERDLLELGYSQRYTLIVLCILSFVVALTLFILLLFAAGRRIGVAGIVCNPFDRIPFDLFTALIYGIITVGIALCFQFFDWMPMNFGLLILPLGGVIVCLLLFILWSMSFATRIKAGKWWKNTLIVLIFRGIAFLIRAIPIIWKSVLFLFAVCFLNFFAFLLVGDYLGEFGVLLWILDWILIIAAVIGCSLAFGYLSKGAAKIAKGNPDAKINTSYLIFDFKALGENLNNIGDGIRRAVDEQMKSERLKTELITNVSHDIKTPLTSIINYVDLLERDGAVTEEGIVYLEVISRQSARLKKLIEDLIQASKASTGNLETHLTPTDSVVLAQQIVGEYRDRLEEAGLEMICRVETEQATILADGQLLYRVFDNLMGNICKYAQPGTRVYLDVTEHTGKIRFLFRNISKDPLHISPDELTERFVRGDSSRNTEGSGLGLSIAKSLTELQGGRFEIDIDGDLFKATVEFDRME